MCVCDGLSEQSVLEPNDQNGLGYLEQIREVLTHHGQYRYTGETDAWRQLRRPARNTSAGGGAQLSACATRARPE